MLDQIRAGMAARNRVRRAVDLVLATALWRVPQRARRRLFAGDACVCPLCESRLSRFVTLHRDWFLWCPVCRSLQRHRLAWLVLQRLVRERPPARVLHIAPEASLAARLRAAAYTLYLSADRYAGDAMLKMDISAIQFADGAFDLVYCSHVLEHVPDDRLAMRELRRVLAPGGQAMIVVPINAEVTVEDATLTDPVERQRRFWQHDHLRRYGPDVVGRLEDAGFRVETLATEDLAAPADVARLGLTPGETLFLCSAR